MTNLKKINKLLIYLNKKDYDLAQKLVEKRDFESLRELVFSAVKIKEKQLKKLHPEYNEAEITSELYDLLKLNMEINEYCSYLDVDDLENDYDE